jgi:hypothetical protein
MKLWFCCEYLATATPILAAQNLSGELFLVARGDEMNPILQRFSFFPIACKINCSVLVARKMWPALLPPAQQPQIFQGDF